MNYTERADAWRRASRLMDMDAFLALAVLILGGKHLPEWLKDPLGFFVPVFLALSLVTFIRSSVLRARSGRRG